jgi:hypothetical protein
MSSTAQACSSAYTNAYMHACMHEHNSTQGEGRGHAHLLQARTHTCVTHRRGQQEEIVLARTRANIGS